MYSRDDKERYAYCKYGDVVAQLNALGPCPEHIPDGGPDTYAANFLRLTCGKPALLISYCDKSAIIVSGMAIARTFKKNYKSPIARSIVWASIFINTFIGLLRFRPTHILCAASSTPLWACFLVSRIRNIPLVHTRHASLSENNNSRIRDIIEKIDAFVIKRTSAVICHGPYLREQMLRLGVNPERLYEFNISYRYLLANEHESASEVPDISGSGKYRCILFVGTASKEKGILDLFEASKNLLQNNKNIHLIYVGNGPDLRLLKEKVKNEQFHEQIIILGHVEHKSLPLLIDQCVLLVTPTRIIYPESRCKAAIEGMILGKPVIVPDFGPFPYVFKHGYNGLLFKPDSVSDLREKISTVMNDEVLYSNLQRGAKEAGKKLLDAPLTFQQALELAYKYT